MQFALTVEQRELAHAVRDMLAKECPPDVARIGDVGRVWPKLAELGVLGGDGFGNVEAALVALEAGRACAPGPLPETVAALAVADAADADRISNGDIVVTAAAPHAAYADIAELVLTGGGLETSTPQPLASVDPARPLFAVDGSPVTGAAYDVGALMTAAYLTGAGRAMVDQAVAYAKTREQFGRVIGSFQAVKHRLADAHIGVEFARPVVLAAAWALDADDANASQSVSHAKLRANRAATFAAKAALQVHGAIGYTEECDLVIWLRRTWSMAGSFGDDEAHRDRLRQSLRRR